MSHSLSPISHSRAPVRHNHGKPVTLLCATRPGRRSGCSPTPRLDRGGASQSRELMGSKSSDQVLTRSAPRIYVKAAEARRSSMAGSRSPSPLARSVASSTPARSRSSWSRRSDASPRRTSRRGGGPARGAQRCLCSLSMPMRPPASNYVRRIAPGTLSIGAPGRWRWHAPHTTPRDSTVPRAEAHIDASRRARGLRRSCPLTVRAGHALRCWRARRNAGR